MVNSYWKLEPLRKMQNDYGLGRKHLGYLAIVTMHLMLTAAFGMQIQFQGANASARMIAHMVRNVSQ